MLGARVLIAAKIKPIGGLSVAVTADRENSLSVSLH
jgi:hypothetical protein